MTELPHPGTVRNKSPIPHQLGRTDHYNLAATKVQVIVAATSKNNRNNRTTCCGQQGCQSTTAEVTEGLTPRQTSASRTGSCLTRCRVLTSSNLLDLISVVQRNVTTLGGNDRVSAFGINREGTRL